MTSCFSHETITSGVAVSFVLFVPTLNLQLHNRSCSLFEFMEVLNLFSGLSPYFEHRDFTREIQHNCWNNEPRESHLYVCVFKEETKEGIKCKSREYSVNCCELFCFRDLLHDLEKCNADPVAIAECFVSKVISFTVHSTGSN